jgi:hypothetical protein
MSSLGELRKSIEIRSLRNIDPQAVLQSVRKMGTRTRKYVQEHIALCSRTYLDVMIEFGDAATGAASEAIARRKGDLAQDCRQGPPPWLSYPDH